MTNFTLADLERIVATRAKAALDQSWTAKLMAKGPEHVAKKFGEEAIEAVLAAAMRDRAGLVAETADVLYHLMVLLAAYDIPLQEIMVELERRTAQSGLAEKASRPSG
jgi:phosphoribosyl-ATP pyrophosphohydrolase